MAIEKAKNVPPFVRFCTASVPMVFDDSMSYYECLCALTNYIQKELVEVVNNNADLLAELNVKFDELKAYVDNYFENLDVQEEINNKLDAMAESGELATYIAQFVELGPLFTYDTLGDLVAADNLAAGCTARTLGKETLNDGFGAYYKIDTTGDIALDNGLYATLEDNFGGNNYYDEITVTTGRANDTDYYVATIPLNDNEGNLIAPYVNDETDNPTRGPLQYADDTYTTLTLNAGLGIKDSHDVWQQGAVIANGVITHHYEGDVTPDEICSYMGIKADRTFVDFPANTTPEYMLAQGVENAFLTFGKIVINGVINPDIDEDYIAPWLHVGVKADGTIIVLASDGRTERNKGMTQAQSAGLMITLGCTNVWRCDAGGSTSMVYKGSKQNRNIDENGTKDRGIWVTLNFKKQTIDEQLARAYSYIGKERQLLNKQIRDDIVSEYETKKATLTYHNINTGYNVTTQGTEIKLICRYALTSANAPYTGADGRVFGLLIDANDRFEGFKLNKTGLYKVTFTANVYCANVAGERAIRLDSPFGTQVTSQAEAKNFITPTAANEFHEINTSFIFNNNTAGKEYYIGAWGQTGDDFNRLSIIVEEIGTAD